MGLSGGDPSDPCSEWASWGTSDPGVEWNLVVAYLILGVSGF